MLLSGSLGALAQEAPAAEAKSLSSVTVREKAAPEEGRDSLRVTGDFNAHVGEADALQGELPLLVNGGIRRGTDVLKALALGAHAVLIGRPAVFGLANAGAHGVAHVLRLLRDELEIAMALTGCRTLAEVTRAGLMHPATENFTIDS